MANETVTYNGKQINKYDASQIQRRIERQIRQDKKDIAGLQGSLLSNNKDLDIEKIKQELKQAKANMQSHNATLNNFIEQTRFKKDYSRLSIGNINKTKMNYKDITDNFSKVQEYKIKEQQYYIDEKGNKYKVDDRNVVMKPSKREKEVANILGKIYGGQINIIPRINEPASIKTPDYIVNGIKFDLKEIEGNSKNTLDGAIKKQKRQANNFVIDITKTKMNKDEATSQIDRIYNSKYRDWVDTIVLIEQNEILKVFIRQ